MPKHTYQLLDSGNFRKLEQVGPYLLDRPAPQAIWQPTQPASLWHTAHAKYHRSKSGGGHWELFCEIPDHWVIAYSGLTLQIKLTNFGHLGLFAEHAETWQWMQDLIKGAGHPVRILNTFAYTGGASLAAAQAGASVVHVDAAKGIVNWGKENADLSRLSHKPIRWIVDDVAKFVMREQRRGHRYDAIILDPPSFGRGPKGRVWKLEKDLPLLLEACRQILSNTPRFIVLSAHTPGFSPLALEHLLGDMMRSHKGYLKSHEMTIRQTGDGRLLPSGMIAYWSEIDF